MFVPTVASLLLFSASAAVKASPCVAFDTNWNLLAFGLDGKDWFAGTQDTWSGSKRIRRHAYPCLTCSPQVDKPQTLLPLAGRRDA
jgi:hypothetical protein